MWTDVDPDRTGVLPFVWDKDFGFERYVEYALDVPMYFLYRGGKYEDATQQRCTFREYMDGKMPDRPGTSSTEYAFFECTVAVYARHCSCPDLVPASPCLDQCCR